MRDEAETAVSPARPPQIEQVKAGTEITARRPQQVSAQTKAAAPADGFFFINANRPVRRERRGLKAL